jgi:WD40 repeat protein
LATLDGESLVRVWEVEGKRELMRVSADAPAESAVVALDEDGSHLAIGHGPGAEIWRVDDRAVVQRVREAGSVSALAFSADGRYLASAAGAAVSVWDLAGGHALARVPMRQGVSALAFSPADARYLATASSDKIARILLWQPEDLVQDACARLGCQIAAQGQEPSLAHEDSCRTAC